MTYIGILQTVRDMRNQSVSDVNKCLLLNRKFLPKKKSYNKMNISLSGEGKLQMPIIGLGTWRAQDEVQQAVLTALDNGYRHIDTAFVYNNEEAIGNAINSWLETEGRKREDLFITTKLPNVANRPEDVEKFLRMSLGRLQLEYVDLFLIHCPFAFECDANYTPVIEENGNFALASNNNLAIWEAMEEQVKKGLCKSIGLSNFNMTQVEEIYDAANIKPAVLQIELHAYLQQQDLVNFCHNLNIAVTAYSPLGSPGVNAHFASKYNYSASEQTDLLNLPAVIQMANSHNKTAAQVLLKHLIQKNISVIPKSTNPNRIKENIDIFDFELTSADIKYLDSLDKEEEGRIFNFLFFKGVEKHPQYPFTIKSN